MRALRRRLRIAFLPVPGQALGLAVLVVVLAAAVVSAPLMIASAQQAAWEQQQERLPPSALGTTVLSGTYTGSVSGKPAQTYTLGDQNAYNGAVQILRSF